MLNLESNSLPILIPQSEYLSSNNSDLDNYLKKLKYGFERIQERSVNGPKFPISDFCYEEVIPLGLIEDSGKSSEQVFTALSEIVDGSIFPQSPNAVFNMVPNPMLDTIAAASLMQLYNVNAIMDTYGGKSLLFEQQVARNLGKFVGWEHASGISCNGGKITLFYAIKSAISRICPNAEKEGTPNNLVIITADNSHYSLEHICSLLGLGSNQCIRVPISSSNGMQANELKSAFEYQIKQGKKVAAIIACGGTTLDFLCDDTQVIHNTIEEVIELNKLDYYPYLHLDSVIGWLWFSFIEAPQNIYDSLEINTHIQDKIKSILNKLKGIRRFDSFGVDLHKNGLCPYSTSFFVSKDMPITTPSKRYGELRAFDHTLENSRSASGIASAWTALQRLGKHGLRVYLSQLLYSAEQIKTNLKNHSHVKILNDSSLGWEVIFSLQPSKISCSKYTENQIFDDFYLYISERTNKGDNVPSISIVKNFRKTYGQNLGNGYICYNMTAGLTPLQAETLVNSIIVVFFQYEEDICNGTRIIIKQDIIEPIR